MGNKTPLFARYQAGGVFTIVDERQGTGDIWWVDSGSATGADAAGYGRNPDAPFLTLDYAIGQATANNGDIIYLMPGHAETLTAAGGVTIDQAGLTIIGLGAGADRPTFTFGSTDNSASILITSASTKIKNIIGVCDDDGLTNPFHVQAADCDIDITWRDPTDVEAATCILTTAAADRLKVNLKYEGYTGGNACVSPIQLVGVNEGDITIDFYGKASTSVIDMLTTLSSGIRIRGYFYNSGTTDLTKNVTANVGSCLWFANGYDGAAGYSFSGGSAATIASDDVSAVASKTDSVGIQTSTVQSKTDSVGIATSTATSTAASVGIQTSTVQSKTDSVGIAVSTTTSTAASVGIQTSTVQSKADSVGLTASTGNSKTDSVGIQASTTVSTAESTGIQVSTVDSKTASVGIQASTTVSKVDSMWLVVSTELSLIRSKQG